MRRLAGLVNLCARNWSRFFQQLVFWSSPLRDSDIRRWSLSRTGVQWNSPFSQIRMPNGTTIQLRISTVGIFSKTSVQYVYCIYRSFQVSIPSSYEMMRSCWRENPLDRPTFYSLKQQLDKLLATLTDNEYLNLSELVREPTAQHPCLVKHDGIDCNILAIPRIAWNWFFLLARFTTKR